MAGAEVLKPVYIELLLKLNAKSGFTVKAGTEMLKPVFIELWLGLKC